MSSKQQTRDHTAVLYETVTTAISNARHQAAAVLGLTKHEPSGGSDIVNNAESTTSEEGLPDLAAKGHDTAKKMAATVTRDEGAPPDHTAQLYERGAQGLEAGRDQLEAACDKPKDAASSALAQASEGVHVTEKKVEEDVEALLPDLSAYGLKVRTDVEAPAPDLSAYGLQAPKEEKAPNLAAYGLKVPEE